MQAPGDIDVVMTLRLTISDIHFLRT